MQTEIENTSGMDTIEGYGGLVIPCVPASYVEISDSKYFANCGIRIRMTESQFKGLGAIEDRMKRAMLTDGIKASVDAKYDPRGFGEFSCSLPRKDFQVAITTRLSQVGETVQKAINPAIKPRK
jgi:hypothetical protein